MSKAKKQHVPSNEPTIRATGTYTGYFHNTDRTVFDVAPTFKDSLIEYFDHMEAVNGIIHAQNEALFKLHKQHVHLKNALLDRMKTELGISKDVNISFTRFGRVTVVPDVPQSTEGVDTK